MIWSATTASCRQNWYEPLIPRKSYVANARSKPGIRIDRRCGETQHAAHAGDARKQCCDCCADGAGCAVLALPVRQSGEVEEGLRAGRRGQPMQNPLAKTPQNCDSRLKWPI